VTLPDENGIHTIEDGERRWRACKLANITVNYVLKDSAIVSKVHQLVANIHREDVTFFEKGVQLKLIQTEKGFNIQQLADLTQNDESWVSRHLKFASVDPEFKRLCEKNNITSVYLADELEKVYRLKPKQAEKLAETNANRKDIQNKLKALKKGINTRVRKKLPKIYTPIVAIKNEGQNINLSLTGTDTAIDKNGKKYNLLLSDLIVVGLTGSH
jgi:ParB family chromosome partitioning protein